MMKQKRWNSNRIHKKGMIPVVLCMIVMTVWAKRFPRQLQMEQIAVDSILPPDTIGLPLPC